uniref:Thioredoxin-like fold domain-containing protein n=1 Tax=Alexandrium catenella TaxID=2925 RepID=A0A7S1WTV5_ALECA|mmetsp:Transcript_89124/g.236812  ORF Transcript_89124/g.236812 Transcript_89124/m.236812 type:complete len:208 (+) Transcript_89124:65-688(+)
MGPPLPPGPLGHPFKAAERPPKIVVELFLDLCCPFSKKMMMTLKEVTAAVEASCPGQVQWLFCNVIQPWHPQSCMMHEVCLAVSAKKAEATWPFIWALFDKQESFFDDQVMDKSRKQLYEEMAAIAESAVGVPKADVLGALALQGAGNSGSQVTQLVKWYTKMHRVRGVHVTPTVFVNGTEAPQVGSGWSAEEWKAFVEPMLTAAAL